MICKYFLPFGRLPSHFVDGFLCCAETFQFHMEQWIGFKLGKEYIKVVYCKPA